MAKMKGHRWFASFWEVMVRLEGPVLRRLREKTLADLRGRVLEVGCGNGANFHLYPPEVSELVGVDPDPFMVERARRRAAELDRRIEVLEAPAEGLPFPDASFDAAVSTLVLCSVHDPAKALAEVRRVLKPGSELRFFEHVRYPDGPLGAVQDFVTPVWRWFGAGCHPNRRTAEAIRQAGFEIVELRHLRVAPPLPPMLCARPAIQGRARVP
jgi:ubiquinone/menaquinone biosynthesis C-methylase UbiE